MLNFGICNAHIVYADGKGRDDENYDFFLFENFFDLELIFKFRAFHTKFMTMFKRL